MVDMYENCTCDGLNCYSVFITVTIAMPCLKHTIVSIGTYVVMAVFLKMDIFRLLIAVPIENAQEIWPTKMDFGRPNVEIGRKMANGRMLFLALLTLHFNSAIIGKHHTQNINHR